MNKVKLSLAFLFIAAGITGFIYMHDSAMVVRVLSVLLGLVLAVGTAWFTTQGKEFYVFCGEAVDETKKVVWPTRKETLQTSGVVFAFVVTMALFLWLVDAALMSSVQLIMGREG